MKADNLDHHKMWEISFSESFDLVEKWVSGKNLENLKFSFLIQFIVVEMITREEIAMTNSIYLFLSY